MLYSFELHSHQADRCADRGAWRIIVRDVFYSWYGLTPYTPTIFRPDSPRILIESENQRTIETMRMNIVKRFGPHVVTPIAEHEKPTLLGGGK